MFLSDILSPVLLSGQLHIPSRLTASLDLRSDNIRPPSCCRETILSLSSRTHRAYSPEAPSDPALDKEYEEFMKSMQQSLGGEEGMNQLGKMFADLMGNITGEEGKENQEDVFGKLDKEGDMDAIANNLLLEFSFPDQKITDILLNIQQENQEYTLQQQKDLILDYRSEKINVNNPSNSLMALKYDRMRKIKEFIVDKRKRKKDMYAF